MGRRVSRAGLREPVAPRDRVVLAPARSRRCAVLSRSASRCATAGSRNSRCKVRHIRGAFASSSRTLFPVERGSSCSKSRSSRKRSSGTTTTTAHDGWWCVRTDPFPCPAPGCTFVAEFMTAAHLVLVWQEQDDPNLLKQAARARDVGRNPRIVGYQTEYGPSASYYAWIAAGRPVHGVRRSSDDGQRDVQVNGIRCERCVLRLAKVLEDHDGLESASATSRAASRSSTTTSARLATRCSPRWSAAASASAGNRCVAAACRESSPPDSLKTVARVAADERKRSDLRRDPPHCGGGP